MVTTKEVAYYINVFNLLRPALSDSFSVADSECCDMATISGRHLSKSATQLQESHEAVGFGTIFWDNDQPKIHFHGAYGKRDSVKVGCLREGSAAFLVLEVVITEILDVSVIRELDPASGMVLIKMNQP